MRVLHSPRIRTPGAVLAAAMLATVLLACREARAPAGPPTETPAAALTAAPPSATAIVATPEVTPTASSTNVPAASTPTVPATPVAMPAPTQRPAPAAVAGRAAIEVERGTTARAEIALTFDCASASGPTDVILRVLREEGVRTTWFMVGVWSRDHPDLTKQIAADHELANHSWAHPDYRDLSAAQIVADLEQNEAFHIALTGQSTKPLWRAPSGARDQRVLEVAAAAGWPVHVFWTIGRDARGTVTGDSGDWRDIGAAEVYANMLRAAALGGGAILVSHCDKPATAEVLRDAIRAMRASGLRLVTVSELLRP